MQTCLFLPPLRQRPEDVLPLARHFAAAAAHKRRLDEVEFTPETDAWLLQHPWPGNIRQLESTVTVGVYVLRPGEPLRPDHFRLSPAMGIASAVGSEALIPEEMFEKDWETFVRCCEEAYFRRLWKKYAGDAKRAAEHAGIQQVRTVKEKWTRHHIGGE
jgi:two-component system response regulator FlrC